MKLHYGWFWTDLSSNGGGWSRGIHYFNPDGGYDNRLRGFDHDGYEMAGVATGEQSDLLIIGRKKVQICASRAIVRMTPLKHLVLNFTFCKDIGMRTAKNIYLSSGMKVYDYR